jgi:hypothetical protein
VHATILKLLGRQPGRYSIGRHLRLATASALGGGRSQWDGESPGAGAEGRPARGGKQPRRPRAAIGCGVGTLRLPSHPVQVAGLVALASAPGGRVPRRLLNCSSGVMHTSRHGRASKLQPALSEK